MNDRTTLAERLRRDCYCDNKVMLECDPCKAADELDRLNAQALELCAEISGLRRELAEANRWAKRASAACNGVVNLTELHMSLAELLRVTAKEGER